MVIGFDAKRAVSNFTGLGNYSRLVIESLARELPDSRMLLFTPRMKESQRLAPILQLPNVEVHTPDCRTGRRLSGLWRLRKGLTRQAAAQKLTLFHGLSNELPLDCRDMGCPTVVTIHDLIFRHFPHGYKAVDRAIYDFKFHRAADAATRIIAVSEATRRDIISSYGISPEKIDVVYQGCSEIFREPVSDGDVAEVRKKYGLPERYIAVVGTIEPRKNQLLTIKALRALPRDIKAVIVGRPTPYMRTLTEYIGCHGLHDRVIFIHDLSFRYLPALYAGATISAYTSRMEGFGIPVIESINCGTPVVACTGTCLEEAGGPGALYVNPDDEDEMAHAASRLFEDPLLRADMTASGRRYVNRFSTANFTADLLASYSRALNQ